MKRGSLKGLWRLRFFLSSSEAYKRSIAVVLTVSDKVKKTESFQSKKLKNSLDHNPITLIANDISVSTLFLKTSNKVSFISMI
jgi:hypothetical protein